MFKRDHYLQKLIQRQWNGMIKIITGVKGCGKSVLLFDLFRPYLLSQGVPEENIICLALDAEENRAYRDPDMLYNYVLSRCADPKQRYYVFLDEIQLVISPAEWHGKKEFVDLYGVLNGLLHRDYLDVYVTSSNARMISKDVGTEFRGRGDVIQIYPLSFREYRSASGKDSLEALHDYALFGGMPCLLSLTSEEDKWNYLERLPQEICTEIGERYEIRRPDILTELVRYLGASAGSMTDARKIAKTLSDTGNCKVTSDTIELYLSYLQDAFLISRARRYDVKRRRFFSYPAKYYCADIGLRNAVSGIHRIEPAHVMENVIYNELLMRGYEVSCGNVVTYEKNGAGGYAQKNRTVDFVAFKWSRQYYIQSAYDMEDEEKKSKELKPLLAIRDYFRKIVVSPEYLRGWFDEDGILRIGLIDFLLDENCLDH